jgi:hypothetical protein
MSDTALPDFADAAEALAADVRSRANSNTRLIESARIAVYNTRRRAYDAPGGVRLCVPEIPSLGQLADLLLISAGTISRYRAGAPIHPDVRERLAALIFPRKESTDAR